jgi:hypothetical protein
MLAEPGNNGLTQSNREEREKRTAPWRNALCANSLRIQGKPGEDKVSGAEKKKKE